MIPEPGMGGVFFKSGGMRKSFSTLRLLPTELHK